MSDILVTRPKHEVTTNYLYFFAEEAITELKKNPTLNIIDLKGDRANKKEFQGIVKKVKPVLIYFNGHGSDEAITGHNNEELVGINDGEESLYGKVVYALSCNSAKKLGAHSVSKGTKAYLGYMDKFIFCYQGECITRPLSDGTARMFLGPSNRLIISLGKGNSAQTAYKKSQKEFKRNISKIMSSKSPQTDTSFLPWMVWDMKCQVCLGDGGAKI